MISDWHFSSPPSRSRPRCMWTAFALLWPVVSVCLFSGLSDRRSILQGGVMSAVSRIFSWRWWSPPGWLLDGYLRVCEHKIDYHPQYILVCQQCHCTIVIRIPPCGTTFKASVNTLCCGWAYHHITTRQCFPMALCAVGEPRVLLTRC